MKPFELLNSHWVVFDPDDEGIRVLLVDGGWLPVDTASRPRKLGTSVTQLL
jgi:hypothetical protein